MKLLAFLAAAVVSANAFLPRNKTQHTPSLIKRPRPVAPIVALSAVSQEDTDVLKERVRGLLDMTQTMLADGVPMPASAAPLENAYEQGTYNELFLQFITFFVDMKLNYDVGDDDLCRPTVFPCTDPGDEVTKEKLPQMYQFCHSMIDGADPEVQLQIWRIIVDKLASRVEMDNDSFNDWCVDALKG
mmetsp:Transcript_21194/g.24394  ORF Transcript_21194/g.24394 Transcript_21194/m.24394 type:complete len:187 (-) Transcript_21194:689-1249(-)|eukprot:CAMPEP_0194389674 /NCGR_PEP_ID=MMETSP0174-20130528/105373_1 /TAXON_ID=216777 /ORGANISM="Proboscia alata, Strain PI-D3" /LENGTH=186 /DNA_ID=CAMNT_0039182165 /DNA_START=144 /DNA_END=704 /DNA_ORIENTATION=+